MLKFLLVTLCLVNVIRCALLSQIIFLRNEAIKTFLTDNSSNEIDESNNGKIGKFIFSMPKSNKKNQAWLKEHSQTRITCFTLKNKFTGKHLSSNEYGDVFTQQAIITNESYYHSWRWQNKALINCQTNKYLILINYSGKNGEVSSTSVSNDRWGQLWEQLENNPGKKRIHS